MAQLFSHLIGNAVKFAKTGEPPLIRIYAQEVDAGALKTAVFTNNESKFVKIIFEDTGIGIEAAALDKIYDIFVRAAPKRKGDGFGSGLAFCRRIVHHHGGFITAQSKIGEGTTFSVYLPV
jgi:signal transduction histidine kinase